MNEPTFGIYLNSYATKNSKLQSADKQVLIYAQEKALEIMQQEGNFNDKKRSLPQLFINQGNRPCKDCYIHSNICFVDIDHINKGECNNIKDSILNDVESLFSACQNIIFVQESASGNLHICLYLNDEPFDTLKEWSDAAYTYTSNLVDVINQKYNVNLYTEGKVDTHNLRHSQALFISQMNILFNDNYKALKMPLKCFCEQNNNRHASKKNNNIKVDINDEFLNDYYCLSYRALANKYSHMILKQSEVEYDEFGYADLSNKEYYELWENWQVVDGKRQLIKFGNGQRNKQFLIDCSTLKAIQKGMSIEQLIVNMSNRIQYYYDNEDKKYNKDYVLSLCKYCYVNDFKAKSVSKTYKVDYKYIMSTSDEFITRQKAVGAAIHKHNINNIISNYDISKSIEDNAIILNITTKKLKKVLSESKIQYFSNKEVLDSQYDFNISINENAKKLGITKSKAQRIKNRIENGQSI